MAPNTISSRRAAWAVLLSLTAPTAISAASLPLCFNPRLYDVAYSSAAGPPTALPKNATADDLRWQPAMDFGDDGCYNVPAIDAKGTISKGLEHNWVSPSDGCHDESDLDNNNVYSRQRCNNGWCVYIYDYYFEKDVATPFFLDTGHTHDWEHIAVWVSDDKVQYVGASQHGNYEVRPASEVLFQGERPKMIYHKDGLATHCFRFAEEDDDKIQNAKGVWFTGDLVSYNGFPEGLRDKLYAHDFGKANIALKDSSFPSQIKKATPDDIEFDADLDEDSPGIP